MLNPYTILKPAAAALALTLLTSTLGSAAAVSDPPNDFLPTFAGPHNGDLDVLAANAIVNGSYLDIAATFNGSIGQTPGAVYVFGFDRGHGTAKFSNIGEPNVVFDSTVVVSNTGGTVVNDLIGKTKTSLGNATLSGSSLSAVIPLSDLPSEGFRTSNYTFNLWPESGSPNAGNTEISDFAPNNAMSRVSATTPEPGTMSLLGMALVGGLAVFRRNKARSQNTRS
jgi:hypothetical protein